MLLKCVLNEGAYQKMILKVLLLLESMRVMALLVTCPSHRGEARDARGHLCNQCPYGRGPEPLSVGKLEKSCFLWVFVSSSLSYALEGKADYFLMIGRERKSTGHILGMGKEW